VETPDVIHEVKLSPNRKWILLFTKHGTKNKYPTIFIMDAQTRKKVNEIPIWDHELVSVDFSKLSNMLLVVSCNNASGSSARSSIAVWDFLDGR